MSSYIKKYRLEAGLTQLQLAEKIGVSVVSIQNWENGKTGISMEKYNKLAEVLNVSVDVLIKETLIEADKSRPDNWPDFLFEEEDNAIIDTLHLNLAQQNLFGLLYIYGAKYLQNEDNSPEQFDKDLKRIPYEFISRVGSIQFLNIADGLHNVMQYVQPEFMMKVLKMNSESEFNVRKLPKSLICDFIDNGHKKYEEDPDWSMDFIDYYKVLRLNVQMDKARKILPILDKIGPIEIPDYKWPGPGNYNVPEELLTAMLEYYEFKRDLWEEGYYEPAGYFGFMSNGLGSVTNYVNVSPDKDKICMIWEVNDLGKKLLEWFKE